MLLIVLLLWFGLVLLGVIYSWQYSLQKQCDYLLVILNTFVVVIGLIGFCTICEIADSNPKYCVSGRDHEDCNQTTQKELDEAIANRISHGDRL